MPSPSRRDLDDLLQHAGWLRSLARSLVADPNLADDLLQDTWVAALEHPPGEGGTPRRWLSAVLRNFAREDRRRKEHRAQREERSARPEATRSVHDAVASAMLQRSLVEAVLALEEPYRDAIVWRYFERLPPREIASRLRVPVNTVKTRLARGIEKLRTELDRRNGGDREAWLPALIPLAVRPELPASALGSLLVNANLKLGLAASLVIAALLGIWSIARSDAPGLAPTAHATIAAEPSTASPSLTSERGVAPPSREQATPAVADAPPATAPASPASSPILASGRVVDADGRFVAGVELVSGSRAEASSLSVIATSAANGSFTAPSAKLHGSLFARDTTYTTVFGVDAWWNAPAFYPSAGVFAFSENLLSLAPIATPINWLTGSPLLAYNVTFLLSYLLCGLGAYFLAFVLTRSHTASFVSAVAFAFAPVLRASGHRRQGHRGQGAQAIPAGVGIRRRIDGP